MLYTVEKMATEVREGMRGGNGKATIRHLAKGGALPAQCRLLSLITLEPGCSIGYHVHEKETEVFCFISGTGLVNDNGEMLTVKAGDSLFTPDGCGHSVENNGDVPLQFCATIVLD
jgi:mannose-6-phosphate isomerase-like protein (cupin superfamily)